jgi:trk system potassium uptake protein TrkH
MSAGDRHRAYLVRRYRVMAAYAGLTAVIIGVLILTPLLLLFFDRADVRWVGWYLAPGAGLIAGGYALWRRLAPAAPIHLSVPEAAAVIVWVWLSAMVAGAIPYFGLEGVGPVRAFFESTSGWTTTGLSVLDVSRTPRLYLLYRSITQLAGGAGLAIISLSALTGPLGLGVSAAEGRAEPLVPHVRRSAGLVLRIYLVYILGAIPALRLAGMSWFDAVNHAFTALSTGGFSTRVESIGYWQSPRVELVMIVLMLLGTTSFMTPYLLTRGRVRAALRNRELLVEAIVLPLAIMLLFFGVTWTLYPSLAFGIRTALFEAVSALSTSGFTIVNYGAWNGLGWLVITLLMLIGGGSGSTAGAIKQFRIYLLARSLYAEVRGAFLPEAAVREIWVWQGEDRRYLTARTLLNNGLFILLYLVAVLLLALVPAAFGYGMAESLFETASAIGTVGLSVGVTGPTTPAPVLLSQCLGMLLGRLEFFTVVIGVSKLAGDWGWGREN